jgi:HSP20 family protein
MQHKVISDNSIRREITVGVLAVILILGSGTAWAVKDAAKGKQKQDESSQKEPPPAANQPDPFSDLVRMQQEMERLFNSTLNPYSAFPDFDYAFGQEKIQPMDLRERPDAFVVQMDLPGMNKSDISIEVKDRVLSINGERAESMEKQKDEEYLLQERTRNAFSREVVLPKSVKVDAVEAEYKEGVLTITLPKAQKEKTAKSIKIR